jgi:hypothetical protein
MNSKVKWLGWLVVLALLLVAFTTVAVAAPDATDTDVDGLSDTYEAALGTNPNSPDTDGDGLCDGLDLGPKVLTAAQAAPWPAHTCKYGEDLNGVSGVQTGLGETDPMTPDTDKDSLCDGPPATSADAPGCRAFKGPDGFTVNNRGGENKDADAVIGITDSETSPVDQDTDDDGVPDGWVDGWDPAPFGYLHISASLDGQKQRWEGEDRNLDGVVNPAESSPLSADTDTDLMDDLYENVYTCLNPQLNDAQQDADSDGHWSIFEYMGEDVDTDGNTANLGEVFVDLNGDGKINRMNPCDPDTDGDGIDDGFEYAFSKLWPVTYTGGVQACTDLNHDKIQDGVMNPMVADADKDGDTDGASNYLEYIGLDGTPPLVGPAPSGYTWYFYPANGDHTSACNPNSDGEDLNFNNKVDAWEWSWFNGAIGAGAAPNYQPDSFMDGFEYWSRLDPKVMYGFEDTNKNGVLDSGEDTNSNKKLDPSACVVEQLMHPRWTNGNMNVLLASITTPDWKLDTDANDPDNTVWGAPYNVPLTAAQLEEKGITGNLVEYIGEDGKFPLNLPGLVPGDPKNGAWEAGDPWFRMAATGDGADATNPCNPDTDRGGVTDDKEYVAWDVNGWEMLPNWKVDDMYADHDYDGLPSQLENKTGTEWLDPDTDKDALCDGNLQVVLDDPKGIYPTFPQAVPYPAVFPPGVAINFDSSYSAFNPITLAIIVKDGGPKMYDLDTGPPSPTLKEDYICGGGEDLDVNGFIAGDNDPKNCDGAFAKDPIYGYAFLGDWNWDVPEDMDSDSIMDGNENDGMGVGAFAPWDDADCNLDKQEVWTETDPRDGDTDDDFLCDGSNTNIAGSADCLVEQPHRSDADVNGGAEVPDMGEDLNDNAVAAERGVSETDPLDSDTDDDALYDATEVIEMGGKIVDPKDKDKLIDRRKECTALGTGVWLALHADSDGDGLYDGFYDRNARGLDVGTPVLLAGGNTHWPFAGFIGWIPWWGFDGPNDKLNDDADTLVVNDPGDDDQPGEDVITCAMVKPLQGAGVDTVGCTAATIKADKKPNSTATVDPTTGFYFGHGDWNGPDLDFVPYEPTGADLDETNACSYDTERDGIWDGTEYASYEAPEYKKAGTFELTAPWDTPRDIMIDTDIDRDPITAQPAGDYRRPALDVDSDGDLLCDGDITNAANVGCNGDGKVQPWELVTFAAGGPPTLWDRYGPWLEKDSGLIILIGEDVVDPQATQGGILNATETWPMNWDTDGDRVDDGIEVVWYERFDCGPAQWAYRSDLAAWDCDGDTKRDARDQDSDSDGLPDGWIDGWSMALGKQDKTLASFDGVRQVWEGEDFDLVQGWWGPSGGLKDADIDEKYPHVIDSLSEAKDAFNGHIRGDDGDRIWQTDPIDGGLPGGLYQDPENWRETDPLNSDTDHDGISDGAEANAPAKIAAQCAAGGRDPVKWYGEPLMAANGDSDKDGLPDGWFDYNGDGVAQVWEGEGYRRDSKAFVSDALIEGDNGRMETGIVSAYAQDGVIAWYEVWQETNPCNPDTDEDGERDYVEVWGWEAGYLITRGWDGSPLGGTLQDGPVPTKDPDADGKFNAVDPNADGYNRYPQVGGPLIQSALYSYAGDSICDSSLSGGAEWWEYPTGPLSKTRVLQRIAAGSQEDAVESSQFQNYREVCTLEEGTAQGPYNPITLTPERGEDLAYVCFNTDHFNPGSESSVSAAGVDYNICHDVADGLIGYGGFFAGNPAWNANEAGNVWVPVWPYQNVDDQDYTPRGWNVYFKGGRWFQGDATGFDRDNYDYPDAVVPIGANSNVVAVGDWDRDRKIDDTPYQVWGYDDLWGPNVPPMTVFKMVEDWGETDPLNFDTDLDGVVDNVERIANYAGETNPRPGFCATNTLWGPVTRDQDFDGALDGVEDVDHDGNYFSTLPLVRDNPTIGGTGTTSVKSPNSTGVETDPCDQDTDGDGLFDGKELEVGLDPADTDTNDDGITDSLPQAPIACALDFNQNGIVDVEDIGFVASRWMDPAKYLVKYDIAPTLTGGVPDGVIDIADIALIAVHWNEVCPK